jgi:hypothetical protein
MATPEEEARPIYEIPGSRSSSEDTRIYATGNCAGGNVYPARRVELQRAAVHRSLSEERETQEESPKLRSGPSTARRGGENLYHHYMTDIV